MSTNNDGQPSLEKTRRIERWKLKALKPHPKQSVFGDAPDHEIEELAASIKMRGLDHPVEILPDGTIIKGHQRVRALQRLGVTEVEVMVRYDLVENGLLARREFLEDNLARRHLGKLAMARGYRGLMEVYQLEKWDRLDPRKPMNPKKQLAARLGCSAKNLERYLKVLNTPHEVQLAFEAGRLKLDFAARVAGLSQSEQQEIAEEIRRDNNPNDVVKRYLRVALSEQRGLGPGVRKLLRDLKDGIDPLVGQVAKIPLEILKPQEDLPVLEATKELVGQLIARQQQAMELREQQQAALASTLERLPISRSGHRVPTRG
jgi:ParB/RepB/Spo0J family partition protein